MYPSALDILFGLKEVINLAIQTVSEEWTAHGPPAGLQDPSSASKGADLPTTRLYEATKRAIGAAGILEILFNPAAMAENSRVLIVDSDALLIPACVPSSGAPSLAIAPEPLLPNYGALRHDESSSTALSGRRLKWPTLWSVEDLQFAKFGNVGEPCILQSAC